MRHARRLGIVVACAAAAFAIGAVGTDWFLTSAPPRSAPSPAVMHAVEGEDRNYAEMILAAEAITGAIEDARIVRPTVDTRCDYISPAEMLHDLHSRHGAECDRPDLDRRMIEQLTPPPR